MDVYEQFLTLSGKTEPRLTIFEHSSDVFQVLLYLEAENRVLVRNSNLLRAGALLHDVGKIEQDYRVGSRWNHQPYSSKYLRPLLEHLRMRALFGDNGVELDYVEYDDLLLICEHHHDMPTQPAFLRRRPDVLLISVADVIASALESGWIGSIKEMLSAATYTDLSMSLLENLRLSCGLDKEIHRVDLPGDSIPDALLNDLIFKDMSQRLGSAGLKPILRKGEALWVVGDLKTLHAFLENYAVNPPGLFESAGVTEEVNEGILGAMPAPGALQADSVKYLLVNEGIARRVVLGLIDRKRVRQALEHFDISISEAHDIFGARGRMVADKLEAIREEPRYLVAGARASYNYHGWRIPPAGLFELLIEPQDFDTWYAYLRDSYTFVGTMLPAGKKCESFLETVLLIPELTDRLWDRRKWVHNLAYISAIDLLFRLVVRQTESAVSEALAIIVVEAEEWDWDVLVSSIMDRRMVRQFGCLFDVLNLESGRSVVPTNVIDSLTAMVQDTVGEAVFTFPLQASFGKSKQAHAPDPYSAIGRRWGIDLLLPRAIVAKVLNDLGV